MLTPHRALLFAFGTALLIAACRRAKPETQPTTDPAPAQPAGGGNPTPTSPAPEPTPGRAVGAGLEEARATLAEAVYFEYDQDALDGAAQALLDRKLTVLSANPAVHVRVVGHADERGSDEYNLALGQRRSATVKRYFTDRGVSESRIEVVSMGEERPSCTQGEESCWRRNRRAEFELTSGTITVPGRRS
ncbi:MAG: OmpA family protein [Gemmatimonadaceae bacterium]